MAKYRGAIGFAMPSLGKPGVWTDKITERIYRGDVIRDVLKWQPTSGANDDLTISNNISIVTDSYVRENAGYMRYLVWHGVRYKITSFEERYPRIVMSLGGVYNGPTP